LSINLINKMILNKTATIDPFYLIVGTLLISGGLLYMIKLNNWGLIVVSIGLLMEAIKQVIK